MDQVSKIDQSTYQIKTHPDIIKSIYETRLLYPATIIEDDVIQFNATYVTNVKKTGIYALSIMNTLSKQLFFLKKNDIGIYGFDLSDIIIIDKHIGIFINHKILVPLDESYLYITQILPTVRFSDPLIYQISKLPAKIHTNIVFYGFALFFLYLINVDNISDIRYTKMHRFVERCMSIPIEDRTMHYL
tara:strand:- start:750 stop:1313 length:564 start_codon:yes stop_codon:yes gene_type:complete